MNYPLRFACYHTTQPSWRLAVELLVPFTGCAEADVSIRIEAASHANDEVASGAAIASNAKRCADTLSVSSTVPPAFHES
jgi:hypothetical protein